MVQWAIVPYRGPFMKKNAKKGIVSYTGPLLVPYSGPHLEPYNEPSGTHI